MKKLNNRKSAKKIWVYTCIFFFKRKQYEVEHGFYCKVRVMSVEEQKMFLQYAEDSFYYDFYLVALNNTPKTVASIRDIPMLSEGNITMTLDIYSHVLPDVKAKELQKIANLFD